jgi:glycosyltransferase involved in cell wall biosynthesis
MTVLQVLGLHPYKLGSFEGYLLNFAEKMRERGHKTVFVFSGEPHPLLAERLRRLDCPYFVMPAPKGPFDTASFLHNLVKIIREHSVDAVQGQFIPHAHLAVVAGFLTRTPSFRTVHGLASTPLKWTQVLKSTTSARMADRIYAVSRAVKTDFSTNMRIPSSKIDVMYNAIDLEKFAPGDNKRDLHRELGVDLKTNLILAVAHARPEKGLEHLIEAVPSVLKWHPDTMFVFCGGGPLEPDLRALGERLGVSDNIRFLGVRDDINQIMEDSYVVVLPSLAEAFGIVVLEAMAMRKPVVASRVGGIPEIVEHGSTGLLVPPADAGALASAVADLLRSPAEAESMGVAGRRRVEQNFDVNKRTLEEIEIYERFIAAR